MRNDYYVYVYKNPLTLEPFYIGKGIDNRAYAHLFYATQKRIGSRETLCKIEIRKIIKHLDLFPLIEFIACSLDEDTAFSMEMRMIKQFGKRIDGTGILTNVTDGGDGFRGLLRTELHCKRISESKRGCRHTEDTKAKMRKPKTFTHESYESLKRLRKEVANRQDVKDKIRASSLGKEISQETRTKTSYTLKKKIAAGEISVKHLHKCGEQHEQAKTWSVKKPDGEVIEVIALRDFCAKNDLHYSSMRNTLYENREIKRGKNKGWQVLGIVNPS